MNTNCVARVADFFFLFRLVCDIYWWFGCNPAWLQRTKGMCCAIQEGMQKLGLSYQKNKQREAVETFLRGEDTVVAALPTGYGKSLIFVILPYVFNKLRGN